MNKQEILDDDFKYIWRPFTPMKSLENPENKPIIITKGKAGVIINTEELFI